MYKLDLSKIPVGRVKEAKENIMDILRITTEAGLRPYLNGTREPGLSDASLIKYYMKVNFGISKVWVKV